MSQVIAEPSIGEVRAARVLGRTVAARFYRSYVRRLPLRGDERVLDFGAGPGLLARHLARRLSQLGGRVVCLDISERWSHAARRALRRRDNVSFRVGPVTDLPSQSFDAVVCHFALHEVRPEEREATVAAFARVLIPGGHVFVREPVGELHGMPRDEIRASFAKADLNEEEDRTTWLPVIGRIFTATFRKPPAAEG